MTWLTSPPTAVWLPQWETSPPAVAWLPSWWEIKLIQANLVVTPHFTVTANRYQAPIGAHLTVTPTIVSAINYHPAKAVETLIVGPTFAAVATRIARPSAALQVTPIFSTTIQVVKASQRIKPQPLNVTIPRASTF